MRVIHIQAAQGHAIPSMVMEARGPFAPYDPGEVVDIEPQDFPYGATAQNGMQGVPLYECNYCGAVLLENELDDHRCEGEL